MASVNDTNATVAKLKREKERVDNAPIDERDRKAIRDFTRFRDHAEKRAANTLIHDMGNLRRVALWSETALVDMNLYDVLGVFEYLEDERNLDPEGSTMFGYSRVLRVFFRWLDEQGHGSVSDIPPDANYGFWEELDLPKQTVQRVDPDKVFSWQEIEDLKRAARRSRDRALIAFLADTGARVSLASQLRIGDIHLDTVVPYFVPNEHGLNHKRAPADRQYQISSSLAELRTYIKKSHPDPENPDAPLWPILGYDNERPEDGAMSGDAIRDMLERCGERAGFDRKVRPHYLRHTVITELAKNPGVTDQSIVHIAGWADSRMLPAYDQTTDKEHNRAIAVARGFPLEEDNEGAEEVPEPRPCGNCGEVTISDFCPNCGAPVSPKAIATNLANLGTGADSVKLGFIQSDPLAPFFDETERIPYLRSLRRKVDDELEHVDPEGEDKRRDRRVNKSDEREHKTRRSPLDHSLDEFRNLGA